MTDTDGADESARFEALVAPYRRELHVHCYRMLGSTQDAEDVLQEALLAAWRGLDDFDGRSPRAWLYRIATNRCLNFLRDASRRPKAADMTTHAPFEGSSSVDEPWWLEPYPSTLLEDLTDSPDARYDQREAIALSFVAALQKLPTQQRTVLVLRDVLGFSASESAEILGTTVAAVTSALQRARRVMPSHRRPDEVRVPRSPAAASVVAQFVDAFERGDLEAVVALLAADVHLTMPPEPFVFTGRDSVARFYRTQTLWEGRVRLVACGANNQPAFGYYLPDPHANVYRAAGLLVIEVTDDGEIGEITRFGEPSLLRQFGLPRTVSAP